MPACRVQVPLCCQELTWSSQPLLLLAFGTFGSLLAVLTAPALPGQAGLIPVTSLSPLCLHNKYYFPGSWLRFLPLTDDRFSNSDVMPHPGSPAKVTATSAFCPRVEVREHSAPHHTYFMAVEPVSDEPVRPAL